MRRHDEVMMRIDHTTISEFRHRFGSQLSDIGDQMAIIAHQMGVTTLTKLAHDGTRLRASNANRATAAVEKLDELQAGFRKTIEELEQQIREAELRVLVQRKSWKRVMRIAEK
jgi:hypothetical protein